MLFVVAPAVTCTVVVPLISELDPSQVVFVEALATVAGSRGSASRWFVDGGTEAHVVCARGEPDRRVGPVRARGCSSYLSTTRRVDLDVHSVERVRARIIDGAGNRTCGSERGIDAGFGGSCGHLDSRRATWGGAPVPRHIVVALVEVAGGRRATRGFTVTGRAEAHVVGARGKSDHRVGPVRAGGCTSDFGSTRRVNLDRHSIERV